MVVEDMKIEEVLHYDRIIFYDGECGFCNATIQLILKKRKSPFYFVSLQSEVAQKIMSEFDITINFNTVYYFENKRLYKRSTAALHIFKHLKGIYPFLYSIGMCVPRFLRDGIYNFIAKRRNRIKPGYCAVPTEEERKYFLTD